MKQSSKSFSKPVSVRTNRLLGMLQALGRQVSDVITEIQQRQHEISIRIKEVADGKKMVHAYVA